MGGQNPYIEEEHAKLPTTKYKVTFLPSNKTVEVDPAQLPYGDHGLPGIVLRAITHLLDPRPVAERPQVVHAKPAMAA